MLRSSTQQQVELMDNQKQKISPVSTIPFKKIFVDDFILYKQTTHTLASVGVSYPNGLLQWFLFGLISTAAAVISTTLGFLAAYELISSPVSIGVGFAISMASIGAGIAYNIYLYRSARKKYERLDAMLADPNAENTINLLSDKLAELYSDRLKIYNKEETAKFTRHCIDAISSALQDKKVDKFDQLLEGDTLKNILQDASILDPVLDLSSKATGNAFNTRDILQGSWKMTNANIQIQPVKTTIQTIDKTKTVADENANKSLFSRFKYWLEHSLFSHTINHTPAKQAQTSENKLTNHAMKG